MIHHTNHNPDHGYLKALIHSAGLSQSDVYTALGIPKRTWSDWMCSNHSSSHTYAVQVAVEALVRERLDAIEKVIELEQLEQSRCKHQFTTGSHVVVHMCEQCGFIEK